MLKISSNYITGSIPAEISNLAMLRSLIANENILTGNVVSLVAALSPLLFRLDLASNKLTGELPCTLSYFDSLWELSISNNLLTGEVYSCLGSMQSLKELYLNGNQFEGSLNSQLFSSTIQVLVFSGNSITGSLPSEIFNAVELRELYGNENSLSGSLPAEFFEISTLHIVNLTGNKLTGTLSSSVGQMALREFDISDNYFVGLIPDTLWGIAYLETLFLSSNLFSGSLSVDMFSLPNASDIALDNNALTGPIPSGGDIYQLSLNPLRNLYLSANMLTGSIPKSIGELLDLLMFDVSYNQITGSIDKNVFYNNQSSLKYIYVNHNHITGKIPATLTTQTSLVQLLLNENEFTGPIPTELSKMRSLEMLLLQGNSLTGRSGIVIANEEEVFLDKLRVIDLSSNSFTGPFPQEVFRPVNIQYVAVVNSCFSGSIPASVCNAHSLLTLLLEGIQSGGACSVYMWDPFSLSDAYLSPGSVGSVPDCLWNMSKLETLHLTGNKLTGTIPSDVNLLNVKALSLSHNLFSGTIPLAIQSSSFTSLDLSHNRFRGTGSAMNSNSSSSSLKINVNRLSGEIPSNFDGIKTVDVVGGNLFDCGDRGDLPSKDPNSESYVCGSSDFDVSLVVWATVCIIYVGVAGTLGYKVYYQANQANTASELNSAEALEDDFDDLHPCFASKLRHFWIIVEARARMLRTWSEYAMALESSEYREVTRFVHVLTFVRKSTIILTAVIAPITCTFYYVSKIYCNRGTHSYQYRWLFTGAFLSGTVPSIIVLVIFFAAVFFLMYRIVHAEAKLVAIGKCVVENSIPAKPADNRQVFDVDEKNRAHVRKSYIFILTCLTLNGLVVLIIKGVYVYASLKDNIPSNAKLFFKLLLSMFDIVWNGVVLSNIVTSFGHFMRSKVRIRLHLSLILFNSIMAPVVASAATDENCFVELFGGIEEVISSSTLTYCARLDPADFTNNPPDCLHYGTLSVSTAYLPPFLYSYQCTSSIFTNFIPVFMFSYVVLAFVVPFFLATIAYSASNTEIFAPCLHLLPNIFWPARLNAADNTSAINAEIVMSCLLQHIVVLITYGLVAPPLAVAVCCNVVITCYQWQILIGRYILCRSQQHGGVAAKSSQSGEGYPLPDMQAATVIELNTQKTVRCARLDEECRGVWLGPLQSVWTIVDMSCLFFAIVFIDMAGDEVGWRRAILSLSLPTMAIPVIFQVLYRGYLQKSFRLILDFVLAKIPCKPSEGVIVKTDIVGSPIPFYEGSANEYGGL